LQEGLRGNGDTETLKEKIHPRKGISIRRQCQLLGIKRSNHYYKPSGEKEENIEMMNLMDKEYMDHPTKGVVSMQTMLRVKGYLVGYRRVRRLMRKMGLYAIYPRKNLSKLGIAKYIHSYLLRHLDVSRSNQVWIIDITYVRMTTGFMYLTAIIDVYSRYIVGWKLSNTLESSNVREVLEAAITQHGIPEIVNSDQGSQFTCPEWIKCLKNHDIQISMDGKGRCLDNTWIERFWRTIKREYIYLCPAENGTELYYGIEKFIEYYNNKRQHQGLDNLTPGEWYEYAA